MAVRVAINGLYVILYKVNEKHSRKTNIVKNLTNSWKTLELYTEIG